jgi:hypothetical protein
MFIRFNAVLQNFEVGDMKMIVLRRSQVFLSKNSVKNFGHTTFCAINDIKGTCNMSKVD